MHAMIVNTGLALAIWLGCSAKPAAAQTLVYSNLGPGDSYSTSIVWPVRGPDFPGTSGDYRKIAAKFTPGFATTFGSARLGIRRSSGSPNQFKLHLATNNAGKPGSILETVTLSNLSTTRNLVTATASGTTSLAAGTTYWLIAEAGEGDASFFWYQNTQGQLGPAYTTTGNANWTIHGAVAAPAFEVYSASESAVPEPSAVLLFLPALGVVAAFNRKRRSR